MERKGKAYIWVGAIYVVRKRMVIRYAFIIKISVESLY
jgi:hypothetical protein